MNSSLLIALTLIAASPAQAVVKTKPQILLLGDSLMRVGVGPVLQRSMRRLYGASVDMRARSATGLTRDDVYDWPAAVASLVQDKTYDRAIVFIGANDCQNLSVGGKTMRFGSPEWQEAYRKRVRTMMTTLCAKVGDVLWLGLPPMRNAKFNRRIAALDAIVEPEIKASACGKYVPTRPLLGGDGGIYVTSRKIRGRRVMLREPDGVHITQNGGELVWGSLPKLE